MEAGAAAASDESQQAEAVVDEREAEADEAWLAITELYRREQPGLVRLARLLVTDRAVAEELVQEAFVRLHPHIGRTERPGAYLRTTLINLCRADHRRAATVARHASPGARVALAVDDSGPTLVACGSSSGTTATCAIGPNT